MKKNQFITGLDLKEVNGVSKVVISLNDGSTIQSDLTVLNEVLNKAEYLVKELWIDVPGQGREDLNPTDLVKFHLALEYDSKAEPQIINKNIQVDDLLKFIQSYGKK